MLVPASQEIFGIKNEIDELRGPMCTLLSMECYLSPIMPWRRPRNWSNPRNVGSLEESPWWLNPALGRSVNSYAKWAPEGSAFGIKTSCREIIFGEWIYAFKILGKKIINFVKKRWRISRDSCYIIIIKGKKQTRGTREQEEIFEYKDHHTFVHVTIVTWWDSALRTASSCHNARYDNEKGLVW